MRKKTVLSSVFVPLLCFAAGVGVAMLLQGNVVLGAEVQPEKKDTTNAQNHDILVQVTPQIAGKDAVRLWFVRVDNMKENDKRNVWTNVLVKNRHQLTVGMSLSKNDVEPISTREESTSDSNSPARD